VAPAERDELLGELVLLAVEIQSHRAAMAELHLKRRAIVRRLIKSGLGYGVIARECGLSKGRIQQLARGD